MTRKALIAGALSLTISLGTVGYLAANYYSALATLRESFVDVDTESAYEYGEVLFQTRACVFCHTLDAANASGDVGPNLNGIGSRATVDHIRESILTPNAVIADTCPDEPCEADIMPQFGAVLDEAQVNALVTYLSAQQ